MAYSHSSKLTIFHQEWCPDERKGAINHWTGENMHWCIRKYEEGRIRTQEDCRPPSTPTCTWLQTPYIHLPFHLQPSQLESSASCTDFSYPSRLPWWLLTPDNAIAEHELAIWLLDNYLWPRIFTALTRTGRFRAHRLWTNPSEAVHCIRCQGRHSFSREYLYFWMYMWFCTWQICERQWE